MPCPLSLKKAALFAALTLATSSISPAHAASDEDLSFADKFNALTPVEIAFSSSTLKSYTQGLPTDFVQSERNFGQIDPAYDHESPIIWLKVSFDGKDGFVSRLKELF